MKETNPLSPRVADELSDYVKSQNDSIRLIVTSEESPRSLDPTQVGWQ